MTKEINNNQSRNGENKYKAQKFRMAYSLDNWQPVQCTLVSDQPFFYMDNECDFDDADAILSEDFSEAFDDGFSDVLLSEMTDMKKKMDVYERMTVFEKATTRTDQFISDAEIFEVKQSDIDVKNKIEEIKYLIRKSRMAQTLLDFAEDKNVTIQLSNQVATALYDKKARTIFIRADLDLMDQTLLLVQELRRHWNDEKGAMVNPLSLHPDQAILINRAQKADLAVAIVRCAWEMKLQGQNDIWARIESSSLLDLGRALAREALSDFRTLNNGKALSAVFETWFLSERSRHEDKLLIQAMLADYRGYMFDNADSSSLKAMDLICKLGEQPFGKNYLAAYAQMILNDALFIDVRNRSNANFLWFIKFERSFQETEQELQSSGLIKIAGADQLENKNIIEDTDNEIRFNRSVETGSLSDEPIGSNVIQVQFEQIG